jgi:wyosine [tRNA(Phe)-imidazoG37] synthetase (radical SAM superfamily)
MAIKNKIINVEQSAHKIYDYLDYNTNYDKIENLKVLKRIENLLKKKIFKNYSKNEIILKVLNSYKKFAQNQKLEIDDYLLRDFEIKEFNQINDNEVFRYIIYRYKFVVYPKIYKVDDYPPCLQVEISSICNFRCVMCYQADKSFSNKSNGYMSMMTFENFKKVIDEAENNVEAITFASRGEPTLNRHFSEMISYSNDKFLALKLNTNASMLNEKLIHNILSTNFQSIVFSIDAADKETYEKIRVNGKFEKIISNLELFTKIRKKHYSKSKHIVKCSGVKINNNQKVEKLSNKLKQYCDVVALVQYTPWESSYENAENNIESPCQELWSRMFVWADSKVNPCDYDYKSYLSKWSINKKSISSIWNSNEYNTYRQLHLSKSRKNLEPCKRCPG